MTKIELYVLFFQLIDTSNLVIKFINIFFHWSVSIGINLILVVTASFYKICGKQFLKLNRYFNF